MHLRLPTTAAGLLLAASTVSAQVPTFAATGSSVTAGRDNNWQVSCTVLPSSATRPTPSALGTSTCNGTFFQAFTVGPALPGGWGPVPAGTSWISVRDDATLGREGAANENPLYEYTFRYGFTLGADVAPSLLQLNLGLLRLDNYWVGYRVNEGMVMAGGITPTPAPPNGQNWATAFTVGGTQGGPGFRSGANTVDIIIRGNGQTDGILARGEFAVVPEPSTYALMAAGLGALAGVARRRVKAA